jgi:NADPH:quinone reductase-like Zn-dependent oxidoreductase
VIDKVYPFAEAQRALQYQEKGHAKGKVILKIRN